MWPIYANHHCGWMQIWFVRNLSFHHATLQPATKTGEKEGEIWGRCNDTSPTDVFLSADKFPCSSTKTNRNLSVAAFLKTNPGSLGQPAVGEVRRCLWHLRLASSSHHWGKAWSSPWGWAWWRCGGIQRAGAVLQPALDRALGITTSRCPSPARGGLRALNVQPLNVTFKWSVCFCPPAFKLTTGFFSARVFEWWNPWTALSWNWICLSSSIQSETIGIHRKQFCPFLSCDLTKSWTLSQPSNPVVENYPWVLTCSSAWNCFSL